MPLSDGVLTLGKGGRLGKRLDPSQVPRIFKAMAREVGLLVATVDGPFVAIENVSH